MRSITVALLAFSLCPVLVACDGGTGTGGEGEGEGAAGEGEGAAGEGEGAAGEGEGAAGEGEGAAGEGEGAAGEGEGAAGEGEGAAGEGEGAAGEGEGEGEGTGDGAQAIVASDDNYRNVDVSADGAVVVYELAGIFAVTNGGAPQAVCVDGNGQNIVGCTQPSLTVVGGDVEVGFTQVDTGAFVFKNGAAALVSLQSDGQPAECSAASGAVLSRDGTTVAWQQSSANLVSPGFFSNAAYYRDLSAVPSALATQDNIQPDDVGGSNVSISNDGERIAFASRATNLVPGSPDLDNSIGDIFVYERSSDTVFGVTAGLSLDGVFEGPVLSGDGNTIAFFTNDALVGDDDNADTDLYVVSGFDIGTPIFARVTDGDNATLCNGSCSGATIDLSDDGDIVVFATTKQLVAADQNASSDVYAVRVSTGAVALLSRKGNGDASSIVTSIGAVRPRVSGDGSTAVFIADEFDLVGVTPTRSNTVLPFKVSVGL